MILVDSFVRGEKNSLLSLNPSSDQGQWYSLENNVDIELSSQQYRFNQKLMLAYYLIV